MKLTDVTFKRRFCVNYYRNLTLPMGEMSFHKNWIAATDRTDAYPIIEKSEGTSELLYSDTYTVRGRVRRLIGAYFPWFTYDLCYSHIEGTLGFTVTSPIGEAQISVSSSGSVDIICPDAHYSERVDLPKSATLSVSFRGDGVSIYTVCDGVHKLILDKADGFFTRLREEKILTDTKVALLADAENVCISDVRWYLNAGISQADLRPIKYENGEPLIENGRLFISATARCVEYKYQVILSWCPSTCDFKLEGALFFDAGDGILSGDVASSIIRDRINNEWKIVMCSFSHGHVIAMGRSIGDPRFGISIIDVDLMKPSRGERDRYNFVGFEGDEDPEIILYGGKWYFAICRCESDGYHYYHFISDDFENFKFLARTEGFEKTGGSYILTDEGVYFACGSDFGKRSVYDLYSIDNLSSPIKNLEFDFADGGFRGWGSIVKIPMGSRYRFIHITFDRHLGSHFNWSYGNIHVFESESFK